MNKNRFLSLMPGELNGIGLQNVVARGNRISFGRGMPRYFSQWNLLTALDRGDITVFVDEGTLTVRYDLSFTSFFLLMASLGAAGIIAWAVVARPALQVFLAAGLFLLVWLVFMGLLCWHVARRLHGLINITLASAY